MKALFIIFFSLLSLGAWATTCEGAWAIHKPSLRIKAKIFLKKNLANTRFEQLDLKGADLFKKNLRGAKFNGAILREADLRYADLQGAKLQSADLTGAILQIAIMVREDL